MAIGSKARRLLANGLESDAMNDWDDGSDERMIVGPLRALLSAHWQLVRPDGLAAVCTEFSG